MGLIRISTLSSEQLGALEKLYRNTREVRLRTRAQMILPAAEQQHLIAGEIAAIVRCGEDTGRRWLKRCLTEGIERLRDVPHGGDRPR